MMAFISGNIGKTAKRRGVCTDAVLLTAMLLAGCESPRTIPVQNATADQKIGDICAETMGLDVTGPYFARCQDYLRSHAQPQQVALAAMPGPAEHRACHEVGLADGSSDYQACVQEMDQLDLGAIHF